MAQIHELGVRELAAAIRSGELGILDVTQHTLERAERIGGPLGAFAHLTAEHALAEASVAQEALNRVPEHYLPPLLGVPCPVKDLNMVKGLPWEGGSAALRGNIAPVDDGTSVLLRNAGTIMVGKTATPEFGLPCYTEPEGSPPAVTPWDPARSAGGSSGGAAAAVAAHIVPVAHASDGGGSIRIPASACGLVGLKATRGRVSSGPHGVDGAGLAVQGVLTRDVRDTALMLDILGKPWSGDTYAVCPPASTFLEACDRDPGRLRIGVLTTPAIVDDAPVHPEALRAVERTARLLEAMGHEVEPAPVPFPPQRWEAFKAIWAVSALSVPIPPESESSLRPLTRWLRELGRDIDGATYADAVAGVQRLTREVAENWAGFDVIVSPTLAQPPVVVGSLRDDERPEDDFLAQTRFTPWTSVANLTGRPAISLPLHRAEIDGVMLPIGVMLTGAVMAEEVLLGLAAALESADPWAGSLPVPA